ncbi:MAG: MerR family transcriptional regulator [Clostridiales bacterium]|nr:MerR family transcriptional regulator [Clostridiales bacterium]
MKEFYKIGEISKLYNIGTDSLRYYEKIGILKPKRGDNGYRLYSINEIRTLNVLRELRLIGFSVKEIGEHLADFDLAKTLALFRRGIVSIDEKIADLETLKEHMEERITEIEANAAGAVSDAEIITMPDRYILRISEDVYKDADLDLMIKKLQSDYDDRLYIIGNGDIGATIPMPELLADQYGHFDSAFYIVGAGEKHDSVLPGGRYLVSTVRGSYSAIPDSWQKLIGEMKARGLKPGDHAIELYVIDNHDTGKENEYVTKLQRSIE